MEVIVLTDEERVMLEDIDLGYTSGSLDRPVYVASIRHEIEVLRNTPRKYRQLHQIAEGLDRILKQRNLGDVT